MDVISLLLAQAAPSRMELIGWAILPTAIGLGIYFALARRDPAEAAFKLRFAGLLPIIAGALYGGSLALRMATDYVYQQANLIGFNGQLLHYATAVIPILGIAALGLFEVLGRRKPRYEF